MFNDTKIGGAFCSDPLWFDNQLRSPNVPRLTWCFQHTVLSIVPPLFLLIMTPILYLQIRMTHLPPIKRSLLTSMKLFLTIVLLIVKVLLFLWTIWQAVILKDDVPIIEYIYPFEHILALIALLKLNTKCLETGITSSGIIFCTWLLFVLTGIPEFYSWVTNDVQLVMVATVDFYRYLLFLVWFPVTVIQLFLHFFAEKNVDSMYENICPESMASFISTLFFTWFNPIVSTGHKRALETYDLYRLDNDMTASTLFKEWKTRWMPLANEYHKALKSAKNKAALYESFNETVTIFDSTPLLEDKSGVTHSKVKSKGFYGSTVSQSEDSKLNKNEKELVPIPSIAKVLFSMFKWQFLGGTVIKLMSDILQFANPMLLNLLIIFAEDATAPLWQGIGISLTMFVVGVLRSLFMNSYFQTMSRIGTQIQSILTTAIFDKTLTLSNEARKGRTVGEIVNLMAIDVERFQAFVQMSQQFWSTLLQVILSLVLLYLTIGISFIGGVIVMLLIIPLNMVITIKVKRWQGLQMRLKDERQKVTNEVLNGIKVIKLYAWEEPMLKKISDIRMRELALIKKANIIKTFGDVINIGSPFLVAIVTFAMYMYSSTEHAMTPQIAFVSLTLFSQLRHPLIMVSELIGITVQTLVSHKRLKTFFVEEELDLETIQWDTNPNFSKHIEVQMASFAWEANQPKPTLKNIDFSVKKGALIAVVGKVGNGKSSLLNAILGEMKKLQGYVGVRGQCAFASQQAWIQNLSLRENILFGLEYDQKRYQEVIDACELRRDLEILPYGDYTEIGEKGINLSGGQKARISLARAIYQNADIYFLDDPLSAVDAVVGKALFDKAIGPRGLLKNKTRLLVTHSLGCLKACDKVLVVKDGEIKHYGAFDDIIADPSVADVLKTLEDSEDETDDDSETHFQSSDNDGGTETDPSSEAMSIRSRMSKRGTTSQSKKFSKSKLIKTTSTNKNQESAKMIQDEQVFTGRVSSSVYYAYFKAMNLVLGFAFIGGFFFNIVFSVLRSLWLSKWSDATLADEHSTRESLGFELGVYGFLGVFEMIFLGVGTVCLIFGGVNASFNLHNPLILNLLKLPLQFFDTTPLGRILNRVGKDMEMVDLKLTGSLRFLIISFFNVLQTIFIILLSTPLFIVIAVPMTAFYVFILRYFISSSRQLQRLSSITRSPLYAQFGETIQGAAVIRTFRASQRFFDNFCNTVDENLKCKYHTLTSARWLGIRLELIGNVIILSAALLAVLSKSWSGMTAGILGLSVSYSFNVTMMLNFLIRQISEVETNIVAVERIKEYALAPTEASWESANDNDKPPKNWPTEGKITFENYSTCYRPGLPLVLQNLHADIQAKEKVGIAGRTGAGKSSLTLALFRIIEPSGGKILIDDVDIASIGLHELRSRITIIPQEPVLFSGTLRFNLDPFGNFSDSKLWAALEEAHLKPFIKIKPEGLSFMISENGENISVGQKQLVCLARAILRHTQILILDEATASIDQHTDALIQKTIRNKFSTSTIVTIAHRVHTIVDYDRIMVLNNGIIAEFSSPATLLKDPKSIFSQMAKSYSN